jgi:tRNA dimethylallyltransferase
MPTPSPFLLGIYGPTASGKTPLAERLADRTGAQLLNGDAFQVYRGLDIGTAKSVRKAEYLLVDLKEPHESFGVGEWVKLACSELAELHRQGRSAIVVGGTGFYLRALFEGYADLRSAPDVRLRSELMQRELEEGLDTLVAELRERSPEAAASVDLNNPVRVRRALERLSSPETPIRVELPPYNRLKIAIDPPKDVLDARITARISDMVKMGWLEEVRTLKAAGVARDAPGMRALGYDTLHDHLNGLLTLEQALLNIEVSTRRYAKRQKTWLRSEPNLNRLAETADLERAVAEALDLLERI